MRSTCLLLLVLVACVEAPHHRRGREADVDAGVDASTNDGDACAGRTQTFYMDKDADGHGDPASLVEACEQPSGAVASNDDCNDNDGAIHPAATESCDAVDNDCNPATVEACPAGCTAARRPAPDNQKVYLFCTNQVSWANARTQCAAAGTGFHLVEIDSDAENTYVRQTANTLLGQVTIHIGANEIGNNTWQWDGAADVFWVGQENGTAQGGHFTAWQNGEPNGTDNCGELRTDNTWYDNNCGDGQRFVCRN